MKKLLAAVLAVLCLAGCSQKPDDFEVVDVITVKPDAVVEEVPEVEEVPVEEVVVEEEPAEELTEDAPEGAIDTYAVSEDKLEGLVGDTIGYSFDTPVFAGFDAADPVTEFYQKLATHLEGYTKETVNEQCLDAGLMASVFGEIKDILLVRDGLGLEIHYEFRVEYSNGTVDVNSRVDTFDVVTGEVESVTK